MPIWVPEYITNGETESGSSGTLQEDLPEKEQISQLMLELRVTNNATVNNARTPLDVFTKIEVVADGVKTLFEATAEIASYLAFVAQGGVVPDHRFFDGGNAVARLHLPIYFGRFPGDTEYLLDTGLYRNIKLRITWAMDTTYEQSGTFQHTISYLRPHEKLAPIGMVRTREVEREATSGSSGNTKHDLPTSYPWHYLGVRVHDVDQGINTDLSKIDVNIDGGRLHLADLDADEFYYADKLRFRNANSYVLQPVVTGQDANVHTLGDWAFPRGAVYVGTGARIVGVDQVAGEKCRITVMTDGGVQASDAVPVALNVPSANPHKCLTLYDGRQTPFPAPQHSQAKAEYEYNAYTMTLYTFLQELVQGML